MIWWHRVGQKVVYLRKDSATLVFNKIYTIRDIIPENIEGPVSFLVEEVRLSKVFSLLNDFREPSFLHMSFQPVRTTSIESLRELLNPTPDAKREVFQEIEEKQRELVQMGWWSLDIDV